MVIKASKIGGGELFNRIKEKYEEMNAFRKEYEIKIEQLKQEKSA
jgi:hypothetical protein